MSIQASKIEQNKCFQLTNRGIFPQRGLAIALRCWTYREMLRSYSAERARNRRQKFEGEHICACVPTSFCLHSIDKNLSQRFYGINWIRLIRMCLFRLAISRDCARSFNRSGIKRAGETKYDLFQMKLVNLERKVMEMDSKQRHV